MHVFIVIVELYLNFSKSHPLHYRIIAPYFHENRTRQIWCGQMNIITANNSKQKSPKWVSWLWFLKIIHRSLLWTWNYMWSWWRPIIHMRTRTDIKVANSKSVTTYNVFAYFHLSNHPINIQVISYLYSYLSANWRMMRQSMWLH